MPLDEDTSSDQAFTPFPDYCLLPLPSPPPLSLPPRHLILCTNATQIAFLTNCIIILARTFDFLRPPDGVWCKYLAPEGFTVDQTRAILGMASLDGELEKGRGVGELRREYSTRGPPNYVQRTRIYVHPDVIGTQYTLHAVDHIPIDRYNTHATWRVTREILAQLLSLL